MASHEILGGLVQVYKRSGDGRFWQCSGSIAGRQYRSTTKEEGLAVSRFQLAADRGNPNKMKARGYERHIPERRVIEGKGIVRYDRMRR